MSRNSAFARVIGLTKSLSPLNFDRDRKVAADDPTDEVVAEAVADSEAMAHSVAEAEGTRTIAAESAAAGVGTELGIQADAHVFAETQVFAETSVPADGGVEAEAVRNAIAADAIQAIEADIASLLATLDTHDAARALDDEPDSAEDDEEPTVALLSELNRLWLADRSGAAAA